MTRTKSAILGGLVAVLVTAVAAFVLSWATGLVPVPAPSRPTPFSGEAAFGALYFTLFVLFYLGVPAFVVGAIIGAS